MVCLSCQTKIEGITERVSVMKEKKEKIDVLFERNAAEQLGGVDWDKLNTAISSRLDQAEKCKTSLVGFPTVFKIAAGFVAAAAVVFITVMVRTEPPPTVRLEDYGNAVVKFVNKKGVAMVNIQQTSDMSWVMVDFGDSSRKVAKCDIKIIEFNGDLKKESDQPMWIIISKSELTVADNGYSSDEDEMGLICLL